MDLNYKEIGKRIAHRRKELGLKQSEVEEKADLSQKYLSNIERSISIPSVEVIMRLALALVGTMQTYGDEWKNISELLRNMNSRQLSLARNFLTWLSEQQL